MLKIYFMAMLCLFADISKKFMHCSNDKLKFTSINVQGYDNYNMVNSGADGRIIKQNTLNANSSALTDVLVRTLGIGQQITVSYDNLPDIEEKMIAVLVDDIVKGEVTKQFLDSDGEVKFKNIPDYIKMPEIHLYKQNPSDPPLLLRKENFICKTTYVMPYVRRIRNWGGWAHNIIKPLNGDGTYINKDDNEFGAYVFPSIVPDIRMFRANSDFLRKLTGSDQVNLKDIFAVVISKDENDVTINEQKVVSTFDMANGAQVHDFWFLFKVLPNTRKFQVHIYAKELMSPNFLCKLFVLDDSNFSMNDYVGWNGEIMY